MRAIPGLFAASISLLAVLAAARSAVGLDAIALTQGEHRGRWTSPGDYSGDLVLTVEGGFAYLRFENASKTCEGDKELPVRDVNGVPSLPYAFTFDVGGRCGIFDVEAVERGQRIDFTFERRSWNDEFSGYVNH